MTISIAACSASEPDREPARVQTPAAAAPAPAVVSPAVEDNRPIILAFGDSLTAGHGLPRGSGYPEQLQEVLDARGFRYRVVNAGISGDTSSGAIGRLPQVLRQKAEIVILELGGNDGLRGLPINDLQRNLDEMIVAFQKAGSKVILAGMTLPRNYGADYVSDFEQVFRDLAKKYDLTLIPFLLEGVAAQPELVQSDLIHPNKAGYTIVARTVLEYLEPLLTAPAGGS